MKMRKEKKKQQKKKKQSEINREVSCDCNYMSNLCSSLWKHHSVVGIYTHNLLDNFLLSIVNKPWINMHCMSSVSATRTEKGSCKKELYLTIMMFPYKNFVGMNNFYLQEHKTKNTTFPPLYPKKPIF